MKNCIWAASAASILLAASGAVAAEAVRVEGNRLVDAETIAAHFRGKDTNEALKGIYATGLFKDVRVLHRGRTVVVRVVENEARIGRVVFVGNAKIKSDQLEAEVKSRPSGTFDPAAVDADVARIADLYRRAGQGAAKVSGRKVDLPNGRHDVVFDISEGEKTGILEIRFSGNAAYSTAELENMMQTTEMNWLSFLKSSDLYDPDRIDQDVQAIKKFYARNGYADFRVTGVDAALDAARGGYVVSIAVEEGPKYLVGSFAVESSIPGVNGDDLRRYVSLSPGDPYDADRVGKGVDAIAASLGSSGYAFNSVRVRPEVDKGTGRITLAYVVEQGPRVYVERIEIRGNTATRDAVIRREFELVEGDAYNRASLDRAERRLKALGLFRKVKITSEQGERADRVIVDVEVEEQSTGQFSVSGGYSTVDGLFAEASVAQSNFMGRGQYVRTAVTAGQYARGVEANFTEPYFLGERLAAGFDVYSKESLANQYAFYSNWVTGGTLRLGIPLSDETTFSPRYTAYNSRLTIPNSSSRPYGDCSDRIQGTTPGTPGAAPIDTALGNTSCLTNGEASLALKQAQGDWVTSMLGFTLAYSTLDQPRDPHSGFKAEVKQDFAGVGGDSHFVRTTGDFRAYHDLGSDQVLGIARLQGGIEEATGTAPLRVVDNFNLGQSLVRGFAPGGIGPRDVTNLVGGSNNGNALGGTRYLGGSLEAQFPIWGLPRDIGLKGAAFADAGTLWGYHGRTNFGAYLGYAAGTPCAAMATPKAANGAPLGQSGCIDVGGDSARLRSSIGASLIWASPMGPIRVNYAYATSKDKADVTQAFSFSGGGNF